MASLQSLLLLIAIAMVLGVRYLIVRLSLPPEAIPQGGLFNVWQKIEGMLRESRLPGIGPVKLGFLLGMTYILYNVLKIFAITLVLLIISTSGDPSSGGVVILLFLPALPWAAYLGGFGTSTLSLVLGYAINLSLLMLVGGSYFAWREGRNCKDT